MSSNYDILEAGIAAAKQKRYSEAIKLLEAFCHNSIDTNTKNYLQAKMWLVKAYQATGDLEEAIALCQQMTNNQNPEVASWAKKILPALSSSKNKESNSDKLTKLFASGCELFRHKQYAEAIQLLEIFLELSTDKNSLEYNQAKTLLLKAHQHK